jgi:hypothetical protein
MTEHAQNDRGAAGKPSELAAIRGLLKRNPGRRIRVERGMASILDKSGRAVTTATGATREDAVTALSTQAATTAGKTDVIDQEAERVRMWQRIRLAEAEDWRP